MEVESIRTKIKEIIANVTNLDPAKIGDTDSYIDDLNLDSLSLLEIGVDVDYAFKLNLPEERMRSLSNVEETVALVLERLSELAQPQPEAALA
ncbi:MAG TPA: phosphopantetheine-binding protein [Thermoanaerobaculia bacterium]|nr:phosphopantetheine-binding protein [Thermoanaerobaculia bacterium]